LFTNKSWRRSGRGVESVGLQKRKSRDQTQPRALCCVLMKDTLLQFPLSTQVYKLVPDPVQDWGRSKATRERRWGPHYAGPVKSEISLTYDNMVLVIPLPFLNKSRKFKLSLKLEKYLTQSKQCVHAHSLCEKFFGLTIVYFDKLSIYVFTSHQAVLTFMGFQIRVSSGTSDNCI